MQIQKQFLAVTAALVVTIPILAQEGGGGRPAPRPVGSMIDLMVKVIYPTSDAILYISSRTPTSEEEWNALEGKAMMLAESANLIMMPNRAYDRGQWMRDSQLMLDAGIAAYEAAMERDVDALIDLNGQVYDSCVVCHKHYRDDYGDAARKLEAESKAAGAQSDPVDQN